MPTVSSCCGSWGGDRVDASSQSLLPSPVVLVLPADARLIRLARLLASGVATRLGLSHDEIEDLRIGVDEVCATLVEAATGPAITLSYAVTDGSLVVSGHTSSGAPIDEARLSISHRILQGIAHEHDVSYDGDTVSFRVVHRLNHRSVR
jgi:serine/threonine-protein kinase RsbW